MAALTSVDLQARFGPDSGSLPAQQPVPSSLEDVFRPEAGLGRCAVSFKELCK